MAPTEPSDDKINLRAYASRIAFTGSFEPTFEALCSIVEKHCSAIPFENLDVLLRRPLELGIPQIEKKLITNRRGGYCFEQNGFLYQLLTQVGFQVRALSGRVRLESPRDVIPPRTHLFLVVTLNGEEWLVDVGVGGFTLTSPIRFELNVEQETKHETRRIVFEEGVYFHQAKSGDRWIDVYEFTGEVMPRIDQEVGNWWTSTNPNSKFRKNLLCSKSCDNGERIGLLNNRFTRRRGDVVLVQEIVETNVRILEILNEEFGLEFPAGTTFQADFLELKS